MTSAPQAPWRRAWFIVTGLIALSLTPVLAGTARLVQLATGAPLAGDAARFASAPGPVVVHIMAASLFGILGAFQFAPPVEPNHRRRHRLRGRIVLPCGLVAGLTGLWMTQVYPDIPTDSAALYAVRMVVGCAMLAQLGLAILAVRQRNFQAHGAWMVRAYALGMGAGTQVFTHLPWFVLAGTPGPTARAVLMAAGWLINAAVAEWIVSRSARSGQQASTSL